MQSNLVAAESFMGSAEYTPSTFVAFKITSALISSARSAAAESVVKNGLPVPAANMTTRAFSRWRTAPDKRFGQFRDGDSRKHSRVNIQFFQCVLQNNGVHYRRQHADVIGGRAIHVAGAFGNSTKYVSAANHNCDLYPQSVNLFDFFGDGMSDIHINTVILFAHQGLARDLQEYTMECWL